MVPPPEYLVSAEIEYILFKSVLIEFTHHINDGRCNQESSTCASVFTSAQSHSLEHLDTRLRPTFLATSMEKKITQAIFDKAWPKIAYKRQTRPTKILQQVSYVRPLHFHHQLPVSSSLASTSFIHNQS